MNISNDMSINRQQLQQVSNINKNDDKVAVKQAADEKKPASGVAVSFGSNRIKDMDDIINENILSASSSIKDISMAEEMIRKANQRILNNSDDAIMTQSKQSANVAMELLK